MASVSSFSNKQSISSFSKSYEEAMDVQKVFTLKKSLFPLTLPFKFDNKTIIIFKLGQSILLGAVLDACNTLKVITGSKINNPLNPNENQVDLIKRLENSSSKNWDIALNVQDFSLTLWPHLEAEGRYDQKNFIETLADAKKRLNNMTEGKGALNRKHYTAFRIEKTGRVLLDKEGGPLLNPKKGKAYDHVKDVHGSQNAAVRLIKDIKDRLRFSDLKPEERVELEKILRKTSIILDDSKKFIKTPIIPKPAKKDFEQVVQQTRLTNSYKASNPHNPIPARKGSSGDIGGVACGVEYIKGLFESEDALFENEHIFCFPKLLEGELPFSDNELRQILRELAIGIYVYNTVPFFSLHFKQGTADLFPVIHPAYENTLVGRVIGMLDYMMKGYLNGGVYSEDFIDEWYKNPEWYGKEQTALEKLINFGEYCREHLEGIDKNYITINDLTNLVKPNGVLDIIKDAFVNNPEEEFFKNHEGFKNSFRIIAKQNSYQKDGNVFLIDGDFSVGYTIEPTAEYKEALKKYVRKHGKQPQSYLDLEDSFRIMSDRIHRHMKKLPICKEFFQMLNVISFFSSYFSTLKNHRKIPVLPTLELIGVKGCPPLFPYLPIAMTTKEVLKFNLKEVFDNYFNNNKKPVRKFFNELYHFLFLKYKEGNRAHHFLYNQKDELINLLKTEIKQIVLGHLSSPLKRVLRDDENFEKVWNDYAVNLFQSLIDRFDILMKNYREKREYYNKSEQHLANVGLMIFSNAYSTFVDFKQIKDEEIIIKEISSKVIPLPHEIQQKTKETFNKVVGGCGLELIAKPIQPSRVCSVIQHQNWTKIQNMLPETWQKIKWNNSYGAAFSLSFEDEPLDLLDNYAWMESILIVPENADPEQLNHRIEIQEAIASNNEEVFKEQLHDLPNLDQMIDRDGKTLLHHAALMNNPFYLRALIKKGLNYKWGDVHGYLPIHYAAMNNCEENVELLLSHDKSLIYARSKNGSTPLITAIQHGNTQIVRLLLNQEHSLANLANGYTELHTAIHYGHVEIIKLLLKNERIVNNCINICCEEGGTPLMMACELDLYEIVELLIIHKADVSQKRNDGVTAIEIAVRNNFTSILQLLLKNASPTHFAIEAAAQEGNLETIKLISESAKDFSDYKNSCDDTLLHIALRYGNLQAALFLVDHVIIIDAKNIEDETPVMLAVSLGAWDVIDRLFERGAVIDYRLLIQSGYNSVIEKIFKAKYFYREELEQYLLIAAKSGNAEFITNILEPNGIDLVSFEGASKRKLVHYLAEFDSLYLFIRLIAQTNDYLQPLQILENKTLAYIAAQKGSRKIFSFLLQAIKKNNLSLEKHFGSRHLLYAVIESNQEEMLNEMLNVFDDRDLVNLPLDKKNTYPILLAAQNNSTKMIKVLVNRGADLTKQSFLYHAVQYGEIDLINLARERQVPVTAQALYLASKNNENDSFDLLMQMRPSQPTLDSALYLAVAENNILAFMRLCDHGATSRAKYKNGYTLVLLAAYKGFEDILELLINQGPRDETYYKNDNALQLACKFGHAGCVELLLEAEYALEPNKEGLTPLDLAKDHPGVINILQNQQKIRAKKIQDLKDAISADNIEDLERALKKFHNHDKISVKLGLLTYWGTPLQFVIKAAHHKSHIKEHIHLLYNFSKGAENIRDINGDTFAHLLLKMELPYDLPGIDLTLKNNKGQTPFHIAAQYANELTLNSLIYKLEKLNFDFNTLDNSGCNAAFYAIKSNFNFKEIILCLKSANVLLNKSNHQLETPLYLACKNKDPITVKLLLKHKVNPNFPATSKKIFPLHQAIEDNYEEITRLLLLNEADPNVLDEKGWHGLHKVALNGDKKLLQLLAVKSGKMNFKTEKGLEPIHIAASQGHTDLLKTFLTLGTSINNSVRAKNVNKQNKSFQGITLLHMATEGGHVETVKWLLSQRAHIDAKTTNGEDIVSFAASSGSKAMLDLFITDKANFSLPMAAFKAIIYDNLEAVEKIYKHSLTINMPLFEECTGLHVASTFGAPRCTSWLLQNGADAKIICEGKNALELSASNHSYEQFRLLLDFTEVDPNEPNDREQTLMHFAALAGNVKHMMLLVLRGALVDNADYLGLTPLHLAAQENNYQVARLLLALGANQNHLTVDEKMAVDLIPQEGNDQLQQLFKVYKELDEEEKDQSRIHRAIRANYPQIITLLSKLDDINHQDAEGHYALHLAVQMGQIDSVLRLLKAGAIIDCQDFEEHTPLWYACVQNPHPVIARMLIKGGADPFIIDSTGFSIIEQVQEAKIKNKNQILKILSKPKINKNQLVKGNK